MASLSFFKISFKSISFALRHIVLLSILNIIAYNCFNGYFVQILEENFHFYTNFIINSKNIIALILSLIILTIKSIMYSTAINYEKNGASVNIFDYFGEISDRFINVFTNIVVFLLLLLISTICFVVPGIIVYSILAYSIFFSAGKTENSKNKNNFQENYNLNTSLYRSLEVSQGHRFNLFINNILIISLLVYLLYFVNYDFYINTWFDSNCFIKFLIFDIFIIFTFKTGAKLDRADDKEFEAIKNQEKNIKFEINKIKTEIPKDTKMKELGESYIKKKIR